MTSQGTLMTHPLRTQQRFEWISPNELAPLLSTKFMLNKTYLVETWGVGQPIRFFALDKPTWIVMRSSSVAAPANKTRYADMFLPHLIAPTGVARIDEGKGEPPKLHNLVQYDITGWSECRHSSNGLTFVHDRQGRIYMRVTTILLEEKRIVYEMAEAMLERIMDNRRLTQRVPEWPLSMPMGI